MCEKEEINSPLSTVYDCTELNQLSQTNYLKLTKTTSFRFGAVAERIIRVTLESVVIFREQESLASSEGFCFLLMMTHFSDLFLFGERFHNLSRSENSPHTYRNNT